MLITQIVTCYTDWYQDIRNLLIFLLQMSYRCRNRVYFIHFHLNIHFMVSSLFTVANSATVNNPIEMSFCECEKLSVGSIPRFKSLCQKVYASIILLDSAKFFFTTSYRNYCHPLSQDSFCFSKTFTNNIKSFFVLLNFCLSDILVFAIPLLWVMCNITSCV